jgi:hypothetical protein
MPLPTPRVYATPADYTQYVGAGGVIPARLDYQLRLASKVIDLAMTGAEYDTDPVTLLPTDPDVAAMMCEATCQQAEFQADVDDPTGAKDRYDQVSISGVSMHRVAGSAGGALPPLCQQAALTLFNAGAAPVAARQGRY